MQRLHPNIRTKMPALTLKIFNRPLATHKLSLMCFIHVKIFAASAECDSRSSTCHHNEKMKAALYNLPTELITTILIDYEAHELLYVNRWFYEVGIEDFCTGELYSPKTLKEGPIEQQLHDYYTFISSLNPGSLYTNSIECVRQSSKGVR